MRQLLFFVLQCAGGNKYSDVNVYTMVGLSTLTKWPNNRPATVNVWAFNDIYQIIDNSPRITPLKMFH